MGKLIYIKSDRMGRENEELGRVLMKNYLYALARSAVKPSMVFLVNNGVKLACEGSQSIDDLFLLVEAGVPVYACGTCLDYFQLTDALKVGGVGKMADLVVQMMESEDVITVS